MPLFVPFGERARIMHYFFACVRPINNFLAKRFIRRARAPEKQKPQGRWTLRLFEFWRSGRGSN
ncbi:hypothetical protein ACLQ8Z_23275, partial [Bordetella hinzii]|uniref:hypothetical protein n=1 Tax=Bordetella hinzii TaxID=103855 RepID=UPI0039FD50CC